MTLLRKKKKDLFLLANKLIETIPDPRNAKEHYKLFMKKESTKSGKQSEVIIYERKTFKNPNIVDIKSIIIEHPKNFIREHPKTSRKLSTIIR